MMRSRVAWSIVALALPLLAVPARGQSSVSVQFHAGRVTLRAQNAPMRLILAEWSRAGGVTIVNGDQINNRAETLEIVGIPEHQAIDLLLRGVAGYVLGPRSAGTPGASAFDRILILPTSRVVASAPPVAPREQRVRGTPPPDVLARFLELGAEGPAANEPPAPQRAVFGDPAESSEPPQITEEGVVVPRVLIPPPAPPDDEPQKEEAAPEKR